VVEAIRSQVGERDLVAALELPEGLLPDRF
jgi:hypothetical protein